MAQRRGAGRSGSGGDALVCHVESQGHSKSRPRRVSPGACTIPRLARRGGELPVPRCRSADARRWRKVRDLARVRPSRVVAYGHAGHFARSLFGVGGTDRSHFS